MTDSVPTITFSNPGELDPRLISTLGVNVKEGNSPIGYFGTGLKYAIAVLLREGQEIKIWSGLERTEFQARAETIRGKEFQTIWAKHGEELWQRLGITTELGKNWTLQNAYRELYCNALDEGGGEGEVAPAPGRVTVQVSGHAFAHVHAERGEFLILPERKPIFSSPELGEIYSGRSSQVFYKGIAVGPFVGDEYSPYTYNLPRDIALSEDRTYKDEWNVRQKLAALLAGCKVEQVLEKTLQTDTGVEQHFLFTWVKHSEEFYKVVGRLLETHSESMNKNAKAAYYKERGKPKKKRRLLQLEPQEQQALEEACEFWRAAGLPVDEYPIKLVASLSTDAGVRVFAEAEDGVIWLTPEAIGDAKLLKLALIEEWVHLKHGVFDETRDMQNVIFAKLVQLAERLGQQP